MQYATTPPGDKRIHCSRFSGLIIVLLSQILQQILIECDHRLRLRLLRTICRSLDCFLGQGCMEATIPNVTRDAEDVSISGSRTLEPDSLKDLRSRKLVTPGHRVGEILLADIPDDLPKTDNVQGDIYILFPKMAENFIFFVIKDVTDFKSKLKNYTPTNTTTVLQNLKEISKKKGTEDDPHVDLQQSQIAFTQSGLITLGVIKSSDKLGDSIFDDGPLWKQVPKLGDSQRDQYSPAFKYGKKHGVFMVAASDPDLCKKESDRIKALFGFSIGDVDEEAGFVRPGKKNRGHEHFGYKDGVSQPALRGLVKPHKGQLQADPGVVVMGYKGDPLLKTRPAWMKDGTYMVIRKLEQDVPYFNKYLQFYSPNWRDYVPKDHDSNKDPLSTKEAEELVGARLVGRWKSGAPLALAPVRDNPTMAADKEQVNNFDYTVQGQLNPSDYYCPFTAHARKTAPRNLDPGIPYGLEIGDPNATTRGLLFVCYQSSIDNGFYRQTAGFAGNDFFPHTDLIPKYQGQDPIIGGPPKIYTATPDQGGDVAESGKVTVQVTNGDGTLVEVTGFSSVVQKSVTSMDPYPVTSRGGEFFFVPSLSTLASWAS
ncbi:Dye-decolorizing peroxidase msp1 [Grifola frondosa]|uniref:Dye-decolorizing peroxidase msp1 n=1 Tax=Grifola frondosa TaxID=5627 RepID=A0A1C7M853_GRIFR|nr:Dye-decolorizing peroxidase msp1 [Grifola frondosa]